MRKGLAVKKLILFSCAAAAFSLFAERFEFERYRSILDRHPFGPEPPGFDANANPKDVQKTAGGAAGSGEELTPEQEVLSKSLRFSVLNVEADGTVMVGFSDVTDQKNARHYYLAVGDEQDGWTVREADPEKESAVFVKSGVELELTVGSSSGGAAKGGAAKAAKTGAAPRADSRSPLLSRASATGGATAPSTRAGRRALRQQEAAEAAAKEEERKAAEAERRARDDEEKAQREAERAAEQAAQREQLDAIQEELRRAREEKAARRAAEAAEEKQGGDAAPPPAEE